MAMPPTVLPNREVVPGTREVHHWKAAADDAHKTPGALLKPAENGETDPYDIARVQGHATDSFQWLQKEVGPVHLEKGDLQHLGGLKVAIWQCENCMARNHHHNLECELCNKARCEGGGKWASGAPLAKYPPCALHGNHRRPSHSYPSPPLTLVNSDILYQGRTW